MPAATAKLTKLPTASLGGVQVRHHILDSEAKRLSWLARRLGIRLSNILKALPEDVLPDEEWRKFADWYSKTMLGLFKENRERARIVAALGLHNGSSMKPLTDEEYQKELDALAELTVRDMPKEKLLELLAAKESAGESCSEPSISSVMDASGDSSATPSENGGGETPSHANGHGAQRDAVTQDIGSKQPRAFDFSDEDDDDE